VQRDDKHRDSLGNGQYRHYQEQWGLNLILDRRHRRL
jgi:hypothetical protein